MNVKPVKTTVKSVKTRTVKTIVSAIVSIGVLALTGLPASARDAILRADFPGDRINLLSTPSVESTPLGFGVPGDRVQVLAPMRVVNGDVWYRVRLRKTGAEGWVNETYLRDTTDAPSPNRRPIIIVDRDNRYSLKDYKVRIFTTRDGQTRINVFNTQTGQTERNGVPVSERRNENGVSYEGRNVIFFMNYNTGEKTLQMF